jgi:hypothetical protein
MLKSVVINAIECCDSCIAASGCHGRSKVLTVLGLEYPVTFRVWSSKHSIVGWIVDRSHEKARFVCRLSVLEAPFQVDIAVHIMPLLPTLL